MAQDAEFVLFLSNKSRIAEDQLKPFARVYRLPLVSLRKSLGSALIYLLALLYCSWLMRGILRRERCERLQLNDFHFAHGAVLRMFGYSGRIVTWFRLDPARYGIIGSVWVRLARLSSNRLVVVSRYIRGQVRARTVDVVFDPVPETTMIGSSAEPNFVFMGSYQHLKGQDAAIDAFHRIAAKHERAELSFHGSDMGLPGSRAFLSELRKRAENGPGAGRIHFRPFVKDPADALGSARVALCFSRSEPFGLVCQEASAHGLPVIATRSGGPEEIVEDGVSGFLVDVDDVPAMARRMDELLSDIELARKFGVAGAALVRERFPAERYQQQFREIFGL
ncbi:MAG TPA: glycosyltransferase family 4 protein [Chthoniobacterales bacterium]|nr:glycosyltransferase family 4 protein [Chthoniobacterales bacterium]